VNDTFQNGAELFADCLVSNGVEIIFAITGAGNLALLDAIEQTKLIQIIYSHHEQAAVMEAQGYSRVTGKVGVAIVTTGGGTSNAATGILSAHLDSIPVLIVSGNESSFHCDKMSSLRALGVQGFDSCRVIAPVAKEATRIMKSSDIRSIFNASWRATTFKRPGPVLVDFPMDIQRNSIVPSEESEVFGDQTAPLTFANFDYKDLAIRLAKASRPLLYFGNGIRSLKAQTLAKDIVEKFQIPFGLSWSAADIFSDQHRLNIGRIGIYGDRAANIILQKADLFVSIGSRLAIPQIGYDKSDFARHATKFVVDIDEFELEKFEGEDWVKIHSPAEEFLADLTSACTSLKLPYTSGIWVNEIEGIWNELPRIKQVGRLDFGNGFVHSAEVVETLNSMMEQDAIITTDVGAGLLTGHYMLSLNGKQRLFTSQGLGEMGFGLPGAIGAFFADHKRQLICLNTDGGIMFNLQELQVVKHHRIPIKLLIFNNSGYSMIRISQENLFDGRLLGIDSQTGVSFPDFRDVAKTFGFEYFEIDSNKTVRDGLASALAHPGASLINILMSPDQKYLPRLATNKTSEGKLVSPPLEDMDPKIPLSDLEHLLGYRAHEKSYEIRGLSYE
jgi:acetolactate synthase-1/2/3 large subunit